MTITDIVAHKKRKNMYSIFIDGNYSFSLFGVDVLYYKLKIDEDLSENLYNKIIEDVVFSKAKEKAFNFISYRMRSKKEVYDKLIKDYNQEITNSIIEMLEKYKYIDDTLFASNFIKYKSNNKKDGIRKIKYMLIEKGIDTEIIEELLINTPNEEEDLKNLKDVINKKLKNKNILDLKQKNKIYNYCISKGFSYEDIKFVLQELDNNKIFLD